MSGDAFSGNLETSNFKIFQASATKVRLPERGEEGREGRRKTSRKTAIHFFLLNSRLVYVDGFINYQYFIPQHDITVSPGSKNAPSQCIVTNLLTRATFNPGVTVTSRRISNYCMTKDGCGPISM